MTVFRITSGGYPAESGEGARIYWGRWNHKGAALVYACQSVALCVLEVLANSSGLPGNLMVAEIEVPSSVGISVIEVASLPEGWDAPSHQAATRDVGTKWAAAGHNAVLSVPSVIVPRERNFLLNPLHPEFAMVRFGKPEPFRLDTRLR